MKQPIRNQRQEVIGYVEKWSANREFLADKNGKKLGVFESDTGTTRDSLGGIIGRGNQLLRLLTRH